MQASVREVKRLDSISRSPVYSSISEELAGIASIRAYRAEDRLTNRNAQLLDGSVIYSLVNQSMNRQEIQPFAYKLLCGMGLSNGVSCKIGGTFVIWRTWQLQHTSSSKVFLLGSQ